MFSLIELLLQSVVFFGSFIWLLSKSRHLDWEFAFFFNHQSKLHRENGNLLSIFIRHVCKELFDFFVLLGCKGNQECPYHECRTWGAISTVKCKDVYREGIHPSSWRLFRCLSWVRRSSLPFAVKDLPAPGDNEALCQVWDANGTSWNCIAEEHF